MYENEDFKGRKEWRSPALYADGLVLCGEWEENLREMKRCSVRLCQKKWFKSECKLNMVAAQGEGRLVFLASVGGRQLEQVSELSLGIGDLYRMYLTQMEANVVGKCRVGRKLRCVNGSFVNARSVQLDYSMVLYQSVFKCMGVKQLV